MKIGLVLPGNIWFSPYVKIYTDILDRKNINYEIISWNRDGSDPESATAFNTHIIAQNRLNKLLPYFNYIKFIKRTITKNKYDKIIVFGPQLGILLFYFLKKYYRKKFILDYRDLSIEQLPGLKIIFKKLLSLSGLNVISSLGFKNYLPQSDYLISHNLNFENFSKQESSKDIFQKESINILTIGSIRDYESNLEVIKSLGNKPNINLYFVGKGDVSALLEDYVNQNEIKNVIFHGFYQKFEEEKFIKAADFLNIYYPRIKSHKSAMSNRFYNSLLYKRPMIVTNDSIQGDFVEKFNLGISLENCDHLNDEILEFKKNFNFKNFDFSADELLNFFQEDYLYFRNKINAFLID